MTPSDLDALAALVGQMTPGPFHVGGPFPSVSIVVCVDGGCGGDTPEPPTYDPVCFLSDKREGQPDPQAVADAAGVVALVNAAPRLIELARQALAAPPATGDAPRTCKTCGHPDHWHRHDDADERTPARFRCLGYDCDKPGFALGTPEDRCGCPNFAPRTEGT